MESAGVDSPGWLNWVLPVIAALTAVIAFVRWFIALVRKLLADIIETEVRRLLDEKHQENLKRFDQSRNDRAQMTQQLKRIEDRLE